MPLLAVGLYAVSYRSRETNRAASTAVKIQMILVLLAIAIEQRV